MVRVYIENEFVGIFRALLDSGSEANLVRHHVVKYLYPLTTKVNGDLLGISNDPVRVRRSVCVSIQPWFAKGNETQFDYEFLVLPKNSNWAPTLPDTTFPCGAISQKLKPNLADPLFWKSESVSLLLGIEVWGEIMEGMAYRLDKRLISQESALGNVVSGRIGESFAENMRARKAVHTIDMSELETTIQKFWEFEDLPLCTMKNAEHEIVESIFNKTHYREHDGRHVVSIPLKPTVIEIGSSRAIALRRFYALERRLQRDDEIRAQYVDFMREYEDLGHMVEVFNEPERNTMCYYIPHHCVMSSGKFRCVFDGSCKTDMGISLNDAQLECPKLQRDLYEIIMRFRRYEYAFSADVKKMYRQVKIAREQWDLQRIFWRESPDHPLKEYCLVVVTYGLATSPYLAVRAMIDGASAMEKEFPIETSVIKNDFYMDDLTTSEKTEQGAIQIAANIKYVLSKSGFELCKWRSNCDRLVHELRGERENSVLLGDAVQTSVLGLKWLTNTDEFTYEVKNYDLEALTKRRMLGKIGELYDPNGFIAPVITRAKILMQSLWKEKLPWDDEVPAPIQKEWNLLWATIRELEKIRIPRWFRMCGDVRLELHGFSDSSIHAYGCAVYLRIIDHRGKISSMLITAKSRVAPIKKVTIPRLELAAAQVLAQTFSMVQNALELKSVPYMLWSDSSITLQWMNKEIHDLRLFVANRVKKIREASNVKNWNHVRTADNPADLVSRGLAAHELVQNDLWWHGPSWMVQPQSEWPKPFDFRSVSLPPEFIAELKVHSVAMKRNDLQIFMKKVDGIPVRVNLVDYTDNLSKLQRIMSYVIRFCTRCIQIQREKEYIKPTEYVDLSQVRELVNLPTDEEKVSALKYFILKEQMFYYQKEYNYFQEQTEHVPFPENSKIIALNPFKDDDNLMRVGGRLSNATMDYDMIHPIIVPNKTRLSWLIIADAHKNTLHGKVQDSIQYIRQHFWIPRIRDEVRFFIHKCVTCTRYRKQPMAQRMGILPFSRVNQNRAFLYSGVDYAGPIEVIERYKSRSNKRKAWIAVFVCMVTRAIHLDVVTDLSSAAFINCFERFIGRRGHCNQLFSDHGTTFVGTNKELKSAFKNWAAPEVKEHLNKKGTKWTFMTPAAPHQGGIYEAAVKSTKHHLRRLLGSKCFTYEQNITVLIQVEAVLNSRPLYALNDDPMDLQVLTPAHFLIGETFIAPPQISVPAQTNNSLKRIRMEQQKIIECFWARWSNDYLTSLIPLKKWFQRNENVKLGLMVLIKDENFPPSKWLMGKIVELVPSKDGLIRTVIVQTAKNKLTRAVQKLCLLPIAPD